MNEAAMFDPRGRRPRLFTKCGLNVIKGELREMCQWASIFISHLQQLDVIQTAQCELLAL